MTDVWDDDWTEEMCTLADRVANGALTEAGYPDAGVWFEINGLAYTPQPLGDDEYNATERAIDLAVDAVRRTFFATRTSVPVGADHA